MGITSLPEYILGLERLGGRPAIVEEGLYRAHVVSYRELVARARAVAAELGRRGVAPGDRVLLWGAAGAGWAAAYYGGILAGVVLVPLDAAFSPGFAARIQQRTSARVVFSDGADPGWQGCAHLELAQLAALPNASFPAPPPPAETTLLEIVYTSGTTSEPKGVMITHGNLLANLRPIEREIKRYRGYARPLLPLRFLHLIPPSHLFGQVLGLLIPPLLSSAVIYPESQAPQQWAEMLRRRRASVVVCVPRQLAMLSSWALAQLDENAESVIAASRGRRWMTKWWRWRRLHSALGWKMWAVIVGGARLPPELEFLWEALGYAVIQGYGLTETAPAIAITHPFHPRRGAVGRKLAGTDIQIAPDGEILVRGSNVSPGYYNDAAATAQAFGGGWLHTGDLGRLDAHDNLEFLGRKKEVIVTADGLNIYPDDVESALEAEPAVREAAVVADERAGRSEVHGVVVLQPGAGTTDLAALAAAANRRLEPHQRLRAVSVWPESRLPRTGAAAKLQRLRVAQWVNGRAVSGGDAAPESWRAFLAKRWGIAPERLRPEARLDTDLGLSSLDRVELLAWLQRHGGGLADENALAAVATVADLDRLATAHTAADTAAPPPPDESNRLKLGYDPWPLRRRWRIARRLARPWLLFPALKTVVSRVEVQGAEHLRGISRPVLFVANHQSILDVPVILRALPPPWRDWMSPAMGIDMIGLGNRRRWRAVRAMFNTFLLSEHAGVSAALRYAGRLADAGYCPLIFPEGARTRDGNIHAFRPGTGVFVAELHLPVVPIRIEGLFEILPVGARRARRGVARVTIGEPLRFERVTPGKITASLARWYGNVQS